MIIELLFLLLAWALLGWVLSLITQFPLIWTVPLGIIFLIAYELLIHPSNNLPREGGRTFDQRNFNPIQSNQFINLFVNLLFMTLDWLQGFKAEIILHPMSQYKPLWKISDNDGLLAKPIREQDCDRVRKFALKKGFLMT